MNLRVEGLPNPGHAEAPAARRPRDGDAFERTLDALQGRWYACEATGAGAGTEAAVRPAPAGHEAGGVTGAGPVGPVGQPADAPGSGPAPKPGVAACAAASGACRAADPGSSPAAAACPVPVPVETVTFTSAAMPMVDAADHAGALRLPAPEAPRREAAAAPVAAALPAVTTAAAAPAPGLSPHDAGAAETLPPTSPARPPATVPDASRAAPAALVMTVMQAHDGRRSLALRCPPLLRATALALARQWIGEQGALRPAAVIVNGETVSPLEGRN